MLKHQILNEILNEVLNNVRLHEAYKLGLRLRLEDSTKIITISFTECNRFDILLENEFDSGLIENPQWKAQGEKFSYKIFIILLTRELSNVKIQSYKISNSSFTQFKMERKKWL
jgi:hypothetical protein